MTALLFPLFLKATLIIKHYTKFETFHLVAQLLLQPHKFPSGHVGTVDDRTIGSTNIGQYPVA
jgi:hypothetical protein